MRFDLLEILDHLGLAENTLYRKLRSGAVRKVATVEAGRLVAVIDGRKYYGPDIAWACYHHCAPLYPVVTIDGDPFNLSEDNLGAVRSKRLKFRLTRVANGWKHPLFKMPFVTEQEAHQDWVSRAKRFYHADLGYVLAEQSRLSPKIPAELLAERLLKNHKPAYRAPAAPRKTDRRVPPPPVKGRVWFWYQDQFVSLPEAVHVSDDIVLRAEAVLKNPAATFRYDRSLERTVEA